MSRPAFRSHSREAGLTDAEARKAWTLLLRESARIARRVAAGEPIGRDDEAIFSGQVIRMGAAFPLRWVSAQAAAEAFLILARSFVASGLTPALAGFVDAGAACLMAMLEEQTRVAFARSCRVAGEG